MDPSTEQSAKHTFHITETFLYKTEKMAELVLMLQNKLIKKDVYKLSGFPPTIWVLEDSKQAECTRHFWIRMAKSLWFHALTAFTLPFSSVCILELM